MRMIWWKNRSCCFSFFLSLVKLSLFIEGFQHEREQQKISFFLFDIDEDSQEIEFHSIESKRITSCSIDWYVIETNSMLTNRIHWIRSTQRVSWWQSLDLNIIQNHNGIETYPFERVYILRKHDIRCKNALSISAAKVDCNLIVSLTRFKNGSTPNVITRQSIWKEHRMGIIYSFFKKEKVQYIIDFWSLRLMHWLTFTIDISEGATTFTIKKFELTIAR